MFASVMYCQSLISGGRRTPHGDSGKVHCLNTQAELLKMCGTCMNRCDVNT